MRYYIKNKKGLKMLIEEHTYSNDEVFLLCHGFTGSVDSYVISQTRSLLVERQLSSISIDFTNNINESEGDFSKHTLSGEVEDLKVVYDRVSKQFNNVYLIGHSMGCAVALEFCLRQSVDGVVLVAPPYSMKEIINAIAKHHYGDEQEALEKWKREGSYRFYKEKTESYHTLSYAFYRDLEKIDPSRYRTLRIPTAIIYSLADPLVPPVDSERLFHEIEYEKKMVRAIPDAPHSFNDAPSSERLLQSLEASIQFLREA